MTESGGAAGSGNRPAGGDAAGSGWPTDRTAAEPHAGTNPPANELPRWQPFADAPSAAPGMRDESTLTPAPEHDEGSIVPDQLHDAPAYIPPPVGMTMGTVMPSPDPSDVPSSAWITTAPQTAPARRGIGGRLSSIIGAIVVVVIVGAVAAGALGLLPSDKGKILFGTAAGKDLCSVGNPTVTVQTTDPIFFAAILKHHMDGAQAITFHITKDGAEFVSHDEPADGTEFDCYGNRDSLGALEAGSYVFEVIHNGAVEATGNLTVK